MEFDQGPLVARDFDQNTEFYMKDTYASIIRKSSVKMLISYTSKNEMHTHHVNVKNAYLNAPINKKVYVKQPYGTRKTPENDLYVNSTKQCMA